MSENKAEEQATSSWQKRQKIKLRLLGVAITVTFAVMVCVAMFQLSSVSSRPSESSSSSAYEVEPSISPPTMSPTELSRALSTSPSENPSEIPSTTPSTNWPPQNPSPQPTHKPTPFPTTRPTKPPTRPPTHKPTRLPTSMPTNPPTEKPTPKPTPRPTRPTTNPPTLKPTKPTLKPSTSQPTEAPKSPTSFPTTIRPTHSPSSPPMEPPSIGDDVATIDETAAPTTPNETERLETTFLVIGDIPYNIQEEATLKKHIANIPDDMEFLIHVGDIRNGSTRTDCTLEEFQNVANMLLKSLIPVFIVPGDNEYNDCPNFEESFENWLKVFGRFETNWSLAFTVSRDKKRPENFYFIYRKVLYIGLNIVGGKNTDLKEWETRLEHNFEWTKMLVNTFGEQPEAFTSVVIIGHADPREKAHATFFDPLRVYMEVDLNNEIPFLYLNGDRHYFQFDEWMPNFHRIMVEGGTDEPPLRITFSVPTSSQNSEAVQIEDLYSYERYPSGGATERY